MLFEKGWAKLHGSYEATASGDTGDALNYLTGGLVSPGALDRASPNFLGLASLGQAIGILCDLIYSVLQLNAILGLYFLGLALSRP